MIDTIHFQLPTEVPSNSNNTPIDLNSPFDVVVFIVAPVLLIFLYFYFRRKKKKTSNEDSQEQ